MKKSLFLLPLLTLPWVVRAAVSTDTVTSVTVSTSDFMSASIALSSRNDVHMVFVDTTTQILKHAKLLNGTTTWAVSDVTDKKVAPQSDLAIAPNGTLHAVYYQTDSPAGVKHARNSGSSWVTDTIENFVGTKAFVSIAVGADNVPRVVYNQTVSSTTWYGEQSGGVWITTKAFNFTGGPCALALEANDTAHFVSVNDDSDLRYVSLVNQTGPQTFTFADFRLFSSPGLMGETQKVGLAMDSSGNAHFSYFDEEVGGMFYGSKVGASTATVVVDAATGAGSSSDIAVNDLNKPMIVYLSTGVGLRSAVLVGASWTPSTLESGTLNGVGPSVVFNRYNHYLAGYLSGDSNELKFITDAPRDLSISGTVLDFAGAPIPGVSLTLSGGIASTALTVSGTTGGYSADHLFEGNYTITPSLSSWAFQPNYQTINHLEGLTVWNFKGGLVDFTTVGNLFNPMDGEQVTFNYSTIPGHVSLKVYSLRGMPVRTLVDQDEAAGTYPVTWDGRDTDGHVVASGIYLVYYEANQTKSTKKVAVVK